MLETSITKVSAEVRDKVGENRRVYIITREGQAQPYGIITHRVIKGNAGTVVTTFSMYACKEYPEAIQGMEKAAGWGYDKANWNMANILMDLSVSLERIYGVKITGMHSHVVNYWEQAFNAAGFNIINIL